MITFENLHHHDNYSLRAGLGSIKDLIPKIKEYNQTSIGITNYNELSGWVSQYFNCKKNGIKPILGVQLMVSNYRVFYQDDKKVIDYIEFMGMNDKFNTSMKLSEMTEAQKVAVGVNWHVLLYAKNSKGYYNIIQSHNDAQLKGIYENPRTTNKFLSSHGEGVICVIPSVNGEIINDIENERYHQAKLKYKAYKNTFDNVYLELTIAEDDYYIEENNRVIQFANKYNIPLVIGINSHYITENDEDAFKALLSIKKGGDVRKEINMCPKMYYKNTEEVYELFNRKFKNEIFTLDIFENALKNNKLICDSIEDFELDTSIKMPSYPNAKEVLKQKAWEGLRDRGKIDDPRYIERLNYELDSVTRAGFADYFLFLEDVCNHCNKNGIARGVGRGSGCGSLVLYALHIFDVDPIKYNLLFERFLDANRLQEIINGGGHVSGCFTSDSIIKTVNGFEELKNLKVGDYVMGDDNKSHKILHIFNHGIQQTFLYYYSSNNQEYYINCTKGHVVKTIKNGETIEDKIGNLKLNDYLIGDNDQLKPIIKIINGKEEQVFDLEVQDNHHYIVCGKRNLK